jgi:hypothetical protein
MADYDLLGCIVGGGTDQIHHSPFNDDEIIGLVACPEHCVTDGNVLHDGVTPEASGLLG